MLNLYISVWIDCAISQFYFRLVNPLVERKVDNIEEYCSPLIFFFNCYLESQANARAQKLLLFLLLCLFGHGSNPGLCTAS